METNTTIEMQKLLISYMMSNSEAFVISQNIIQPTYFDDTLHKAVKYILEYASEFKSTPSFDIVAAQTGVRLEPFIEPDTAMEWYLKEIEGFCKNRALEIAVLKGVDLVGKGQGEEILRMVRDAMGISLVTDMGSSFFYDITSTITALKDKSNMVPTHWRIIDKKLYGGFTKGSLNIFAGGSGSGKSLFLQNIALNWAFEGKNVIYITLELSQDLVNLRLASMVTGKSTAGVMRDEMETIMMIQKAKTKSGDLCVKKFPEAGTTCNDIRAFLKEYQIQKGMKPDVLVIDYLDLLYPNNAKIDVSNMFTKDKYVSEEMRAIGTEWGIPVVSASQLNRGAVEAQEYDHSHIAGGISKINTADNVFAIITSPSMKERGEYMLQFLKTRSSGAVGQKISLKYDPVSMRITDFPLTDGSDDPLEDDGEVQTAEQVRIAVKNHQNEIIRNNTNLFGMDATVPDSSMPISQQAHPLHKTREQLEQENNVSSGPKSAKNSLSDLIARSKRSDD